MCGTVLLLPIYAFMETFSTAKKLGSILFTGLVEARNNNANTQNIAKSG
jgi:hypothetical protein